jgi:hypothetical protein
MAYADPRISHPPRPLTRREREDVADALHQRGAPVPYYCQVVDADWQPIAPQFDLVVQAHTNSAAHHAWERWAEEQGAEGKVFLKVTYTPATTGRHREPERTHRVEINLDMLLLGDELDEYDNADRALGL